MVPHREKSPESPNGKERLYSVRTGRGLRMRTTTTRPLILTTRSDRLRWQLKTLVQGVSILSEKSNLDILVKKIGQISKVGVFS